ncbi:MAG: insulinase family protein [Proteobacteria bacterium]|nr:insulinase family protein [Pseudomonadota bacterium]
MRFFDNVQITVLDNGFIVATDHFPGHARTAATILTASGGFHDPDGKSGCAHLVEHMFTHAHPSITQKDFHRLISRRAIKANITTSRDHTQAHAFGLTGSVMEVLDNAAMMVVARKINDFDRLNHERRVVGKEQFDELSDREGAYRYKRLASIFGPQSKTVRPEGGIPEEIEKLSRDDLLHFWHDNIVGSNMMFVSAGGLSHVDAIRFCRKHFGRLPIGYRRDRFGDELRMTDVSFRQNEYQDVLFWARARFEASSLFADPKTSSRLDLMEMFLTQALHDALRLDDGTLYGGAKAAFTQASTGKGFFTIHAECTPENYKPVYSRIAETLNGIASGLPEYADLFENTRESVSHIFAEHGADLMENMLMRRVRIVDALLQSSIMPDVAKEKRLLETTSYQQAAAILRRVLASHAPTTEYWGHIGPEQMNGRQMAAFFKRSGASGVPIAAVA